MIEPSGISYRYFGCSIGKHKMGANTELEKMKFDEMSCRNAITEVAKIIYKLHDDVKDKEFELELSWVCDESNRKHVMVPADIRAEAIRAGKEAKERAEMDESDEEGDGKDKERKEKKDKKRQIVKLFL